MCATAAVAAACVTAVCKFCEYAATSRMLNGIMLFSGIYAVLVLVYCRAPWLVAQDSLALWVQLAASRNSKRTEFRTVRPFLGGGRATNAAESECTRWKQQQHLGNRGGNARFNVPTSYLRMATEVLSLSL